MLSASNPEPTLFFLLAPRLPHVVQGSEDTGDSGCEVHGGRVGDESSRVVQLSHGVRFVRRHTWTPPISLEHFVVVQEEVDVETLQAVRQITRLISPGAPK